MIRLQLRDLTLSLEGRPLVTSFDLDLSPPERLLVTADRGEALTALAYCLAGQLPSPWRKAVVAADWSRDLAQFEHPLLGAEASADTRHFIPRTLLIPEDLDPWFVAGTAADELGLFGWSEGADPELDAAVFGLFDRPLLSRPIYNLSGGEKQRLALAAAVVGKPDCLVLLNSVGWLDQQRREVVFSWIERVGCAIVFCDDHVELLAPRCQRHYHVDESGAVRPVSTAQAQVDVEPRGVAPTATDGVARGSLAAPAKAGAGSAIEATDLRFAHAGIEDVLILDGASFRVPRVSNAYLVGSNGSGKSTLASLVAGLERHYTGDLRVADERIGSGSPQEIRSALGPAAPQLLFQFVDDNLIRPNVGDYLTLGLELDRRKLDERPDLSVWLERAGIGLERSVARLDTFQKKLIVLVRVVLTECRLLFCDEITWGLTRLEQRRLREFVDAHLQPVMKVWITHETAALGLRPEVILSIRDGRLHVD